MLASFLAALFFALNATCASHSVRLHGALRANLGRLTIAAVVLGVFAHTAGHGFTSGSTRWFLLSGLIGMGLGDLGVYNALPRLGSRLTILIAQCVAAPIAALGEWLWLGTRLTVTQMLWGAVILAGVAVAVLPGRTNPPRVRVQPIGFLFGLLAAAGQGLGALASRKGVLAADAAGEAAHNATFGITSAYHRILAGLAFMLLWFGLQRLLGRVAAPSPSAGWTGRGWMLANGLAGPVIAVASYQWALATTPSGIVLPIAATAPLLSIPIAFWLEGDRPPRRAIVGGLLSVAGCIALTVAR